MQILEYALLRTGVFDAAKPGRAWALALRSQTSRNA